MAKIDGVEVTVYKCSCGNDDFWIFKSPEREGYVITCRVCMEHQRALLEELGLP